MGFWALPFIFAVAWSGALLGIGGVFGAVLVGGDISKLQDLRGYGSIQYQATGTSAKSRPLAEMVRTAQASTQRSELPHYAGAHLRGDEHAWGFIFFESDMVEPWRYVFIDGVTGEVNMDTSHEHSVSRAFEERLFGFHFAWFGGNFVRAIFCVLAWLVCMMIVAGQMIWMERPRSRQWPRLIFAVERITIGACCGLVAASACYFLLNRSLPAPWPGRALAEWNGFLGIWLGLTVLTLWPKLRAVTLAGSYLGLASLGFFAVIGDDRWALASESPPPESISPVSWLLLALGAGSGAMALALLRRKSAKPRPAQ